MRNGFIFQKEASGEVLTWIEQLRSDGTGYAACSKAAEDSVREFRWEQSAEKYRNIFTKLLHQQDS
jgi:glycosyltransferase involved in cell wall biosynthesis